MAYRDPNAPVIARLFATNIAPNERIEIDSYRTEGPNVGSQMRFYANGESVDAAAKLMLTTPATGLDPEWDSMLSLLGSDLDASGDRASIGLAERADGSSEMFLSSSRTWIPNAIVQRDANNDGIQMWDELAQTPQDWKWPGFVNSWSDLAGSRAGYWLDAVGVVHLRGIVRAGSAALPIAVFGSELLPEQTMDFTVRQAGGVIVCAFQINAVTGELTASANSATVSGSGARLDGITWPTKH